MTRSPGRSLGQTGEVFARQSIWGCRRPGNSAMPMFFSCCVASAGGVFSVASVAAPHIRLKGGFPIRSPPPSMEEIFSCPLLKSFDVLRVPGCRSCPGARDSSPGSRRNARHRKGGAFSFVEIGGRVVVHIKALKGRPVLLASTPSQPAQGLVGGLPRVDAPAFNQTGFGGKPVLGQP